MKMYYAMCDGHVEMFETKAERDWFIEDRDDREEVTSTQARRAMLKAMSGRWPFARSKSHMERHGEMEEIVGAYYQMYEWGLI